MRIYVDADACPVISLVEQCASEFSLPVTLICDTNHILTSTYSEVRTVSAGADAVDFYLVNLLHPGDVVVTQDYGVACMALSRRALCIHQSGMIYTEENIDGLLNERHLNRKARMASSKHHLKGPRKRTEEDDRRFLLSFRSLLLSCQSGANCP